MTLHIADGVALPLDFVTKTTAILAQRRKGKTYTASVIAEELVAAGQPFAALDPTGAWHGLRSSADGKRPGLPVIVLGGEHGDVPIGRTDGKAVADLVIDQPGWYVIDFSLFESGAAERQFATDFAERLYRRKRQPGNDFPFHLFVDEADKFVPQKPSGGRGEARETDARLLGAFEAIVRRGGIRGLGTTLISQRAAVVNKNVLEQLDMLIVLRVLGPNDRKAIDGYLAADVDDAQRRVLMASLGSLGIGEAWLWEPGGDPPLFERVQIRKRRTFNSSATPKPGERRIEPKAFAQVDLDAVKDQMAATIERAKADDPALLRARIKDLEADLTRATSAAVPVEVERVVEVEVEVVPEWVGEHLDALDAFVNAARSERLELIERIDVLAQRARAQENVGAERPDLLHRPRTAPASTAPARESSASTVSTWILEPKVPSAPTNTGTAMARAERAILTVLAQFPEGRSKLQVALLSGYSIKSSSLSNAIGALRTAGYATKGEPIRATDDGIAALGDFEPLPSGQALYDHWAQTLGKAERALLDVLVAHAPGDIERDDLAAEAGYSPTSSSFSNALGRLRSLKLAEGLHAHPDLIAAISGRG